MMELVVYLVIVRYYLKSVASMSLDRELEQCSPPDQFFFVAGDHSVDACREIIVKNSIRRWWQ